MRLMIDDLPPTVQVARDESTYSIGIRIPKVSYASFTEVMTREIDTRECAPSDDVDWNWGEQDSLANIPRKKCQAWISALSDDGERGDK